MKTVGSLLILAGIVLVVFAFQMDTTVTSTGTYIAGSYVGGGSTYNLGLLQQQMMVFQAGLAAFIGGTVLYSVRGEESGKNADRTFKQRPWTDVQDGETEEERDERVERGSTPDKIIAGVLVAVVLIIVAASLLHESPASQSGNDINGIVDMNAPANMNASTEMNATTDMNVTSDDMNAEEDMKASPN